jgi:hypothetical protein
VVLHSLLVVIEMTTFLDCIEYHSNVHKEIFAGPVFAPHLKVEHHVLLNHSLDLEVSQFHNFILNFVLRRYIEGRWRFTKFDVLALAGLKSLWDRL